MNSLALAAELVARCRAAGLTVTTAESCTGGLIAAAITDIPGSSEIFGHGFVTYSNAAKTELLDVPAGLIEAAGAVSEAVARQMAEGAKRKARADFAIAVTGIAGPGGGTPLKPVGTVWFGLAEAERTLAKQHLFAGDRAAIRQASLCFALQFLLDRIPE